MAKKTTYNQTIKGSKVASATHKRQAELLQRLINARRQGEQNLIGQYTNARARNEATRKSVVSDLLNGFGTAKAGYDRSTKDTEGNLGTTATSSILNRVREGANAMSELSNMQAGETDRIKGMAASLRGLKVNLDSGTSDYASAITSINNSLGDLNSSVTSNINNALREQNTNDASAFGEYTAGRQQAYADLVDLYGQQGAAYEQVADTVANKTSKMVSSGTKNVTATQTDTIKYGKLGNQALNQAKSAFDSSGDAADQLAKLQGEKFTEGIMTIDQMNAASDPSQRFAEAELKKNLSNLSSLSNAGSLRKLAGPEGSTLRKRTTA